MINKVKRYEANTNFLLFLLKKRGKNICFRCGQLIDNHKEFSVEHIEDYAKTRRREENLELMTDINNIAFSHRFCNFGSSHATKGIYKYVGVKKGRHVGSSYSAQIGNPYLKMRTGLIFETEHQAAVARDFLTFILMSGKGQLNFPENRDIYKEMMVGRDIKPSEINDKRDLIKDMVIKTINRKDFIFNIKGKNEYSIFSDVDLLKEKSPN